MAETRCGKNCADCTYKEELNCLGCKAGPGKQYGCTCELAKCCRDKGHENCQTCGFVNTCRTYQSRWHIPEYRIQHIQAEKMHKEAVSKKAAVLGKWLWILFWLVIPGTISSLLTNDTVAQWAPGAYMPGAILEGIYYTAYGLILLRVSAVEERYRIAGLCTIVSGAASLVNAFFSGNPSLTTILAIAALIAGIVDVCYEFPAHAEVLSGVDNALADNWLRLRKWYIIALCVTFGSILIAIVAPVLGVLMLLGGAIFSLVVSILRLVYLYRTATAFREWM